MTDMMSTLHAASQLQSVARSLPLTAHRLVYLMLLGSEGSTSAMIVTLYPLASWILRAVVSPTTPAHAFQ